jgi:hypothetical protein
MNLPLVGWFSDPSIVTIYSSEAFTGFGGALGTPHLQHDRNNSGERNFGFPALDRSTLFGTVCQNAIAHPRPNPESWPALQSLDLEQKSKDLQRAPSTVSHYPRRTLSFSEAQQKLRISYRQDHVWRCPCLLFGKSSNYQINLEIKGKCTNVNCPTDEQGRNQITCSVMTSSFGEHSE